MRKSRIAVHGHRGARACRPENTVEAFEYAIAAGADAIELDVALTRDGVPAVCHDPFPELTLEELRRLRPGVPSLDQVLSLAPRGAFLFNIELKPLEDRGRLADLVVPMIRELAHRAMVQSFDFDLLSAVRERSSGLRLGALFEETDEDFVPIVRRAGAQIAVPEFHLVDRRKVQTAHDAGIDVFTWTANEPADWRRLIDANVDAIITDDPAALIAYLRGATTAAARDRRSPAAPPACPDK